MSTNQFQRLQSRYIAGDQLSTEEITRLLQWFEETPSEREKMLRNEMIDNQLRCMVRLNDEVMVARFVSETLQRAMPLEGSKDQPDQIRTREKINRDSFRPYLIPVSLCTIAIALVGVTIAWYSTAVWRQGDFGFARITNTKNVSWELLDDEKHILRFSAGNADIHFENGAIAQLSAPATIELRTPDKLFVENGSVTMSIPPAAVGFTVETPIARIVDLGTKFEVDVWEAGSTETHVQSGMVTFEAYSTHLTQTAPIELTEEGLNHATAVVSHLTPEISSVLTTASGSRGQFFGAIHAEGKTVEFGTRQSFDDFLSRLNASLKDNPSRFREKWEALVNPSPTANDPDTNDPDTNDPDTNDPDTNDPDTNDPDTNDKSMKVESDVVDQNVSRQNKAREMLLEQLRSMKELHKDNPQMRELLEQMIRQAEEDEDNLEKKAD